MDDKVKQIYDLYVSKKLINPENVDFDTFSNASEEQLSSLYQLGTKNNLFNQVDQETFNSAFLKKKDLPEESGISSEEKLDGEGSTSGLETGDVDSQEPSQETIQKEDAEDIDNQPQVVMPNPPTAPEPEYYLQGQRVEKEYLEDFSMLPGFGKLDFEVINDEGFAAQLQERHLAQQPKEETREEDVPSEITGETTTEQVEPTTPTEQPRMETYEHTFDEIEGDHSHTPEGLEEQMVDISEMFPELKHLPSTHHVTGPRKGNKKEWNQNGVHPKAAQFLKELKEVYIEYKGGGEKGIEAWSNLDFSSLFRHSEHYSSKNKKSRHKHGLAIDIKGETGKDVMDFLLKDPAGQALAKKWGDGGNLGNGIHDEYGDMYVKKINLNHLHFSIKRGPVTVTLEREVPNMTKSENVEKIQTDKFIQSATTEINPNVITNPNEYSKSAQSKVNEIISKLESDWGDHPVHERHDKDYGGYLLAPQFFYPDEEKHSENTRSIQENREEVLTGKKKEKTLPEIDPRIINSVSPDTTSSLSDKEMQMLQNYLNELQPGKKKGDVLNEQEQSNIKKDIQDLTKKNEEDEEIQALFDLYAQKHQHKMPTYSEHFKVKPEEINEAYKKNSKFNHVNDPSHKIPEYISKDPYFQQLYSKRTDFPYLGSDMQEKLMDYWLQDYLLDNYNNLETANFQLNNLANIDKNTGEEFKDSPGYWSLKNQIRKGFSYIGNEDWLHLETGIILKPTDRLNPLLAQNGIRVDLLESLAENPEYFKNLTDADVEALYAKYNPGRAYNYKQQIEYYGDPGTDLRAPDAGDLSYEEMLDISKGEYKEAQYNFLMPILGELNANLFEQFSETTIGKDAENLVEQLDHAEEWINNQTRLMQERYPTKTDADGVLVIDGTKMSNEEINKANKDAQDLKRVIDMTAGLNNDLTNLQQSSFIRVNKDLSEMYDRIAKLGTDKLNTFELRKKVIQEQIEAQIENDEKYRDSFDKDGWGKVGGWMNRAFWNVGTVGEGTVNNLVGGILGFPQMLDNYIDAVKRGEGVNPLTQSGFKVSDAQGPVSAEEFGWVDDLSQIGANLYGEHDWFGGFTRFNTGWKYDSTKIDGVNVVIKDGEILNMYDDDFVMIDPQSMQAGFINQKWLNNKIAIQNGEEDAYPTEEQTNMGSFWMTGAQVFSDLAVDVLIAKRVGALGSTTKAKKALHLTTMYTNYTARTYNGYMQEYFSKVPNASNEEAENYARNMSLVVGLTQFVSPNFRFGTRIPFSMSTKAHRNFVLGGFNRADLFKLNFKHNFTNVALRGGGLESLQELSELEAQRGMNNIFYYDKSLNETRGEMKYEYIQNGLWGWMGGAGGNIRSLRLGAMNPFGFNANRQYQESMMYAYKNQDLFNKSVDNGIGKEIYVDGEYKNLTKEGADEVKQKHKDIFQTVDNLKEQAKQNGVEIDETGEFAFLNLTKNKKDIENLQNSKDENLKNQVQERLAVIEDQTNRILKGEDAYEVLQENEVNEFKDTGMRPEDFSAGEKIINRKLNKNEEWSSDEIKYSKMGLDKAIRDLDAKEKLTQKEQQKKAVLQEFLNKVNNIKPTINEETDELAESIARKAYGTTSMDESQTQEPTQESEVESVRTSKGEAAKRINPLNPNSTIESAIGKNVDYKGKKGILKRNKNGDVVVKQPDGQSWVVKEAVRPDVMLKTAGIKATGTPFTITNDNVISMQGKPETQVVGMTKDGNNDLESLIVTDPVIGPETGKVKNKPTITKAKKKLQELQSQLDNGDITPQDFVGEINKTPGIKIVNYPDVNVDIATESVVNDILNMRPDFSTITMQDVDNIVEEEMSIQEAISEAESVTEARREEQQKEQEKNLKEKGTTYYNNPKDIKKLKNVAGVYESQLAGKTKVYPDGRVGNDPKQKAKILKQIYKIFIPLGHSVTVHNNDTSLYNQLRKTINPSTGEVYTHTEAEAKRYHKGFIVGANGDIHVNLEFANDNTLFHESAHPFIKSLLARRKAEGGSGPVTDFFTEAESILKEAKRPNGRGSYMDFGMLYAIENADGKIINPDQVIEEALAEYLGDAGAEVYNQDQNKISKIPFVETAKKILKSILELLGLKTKKSPYKVNYEDIVSLGGIKKAYETTIPKGVPIDIDAKYRNVSPDVKTKKQPKTPKTQREQVEILLENEGKMSIKDIAKKTKILEPNIRRIVGVGAKDGTFQRVDKGVYELVTPDGKSHAYIHSGSAFDVLPKLVKQGKKYDMVFLDPPYQSAALKGGNRDFVSAYETITPEQFGTIMSSVEQLVKDKDSAVYVMLQGAPSAQVDMMNYFDKVTDAGFKVVGEGKYQKLYQSGKPIINVRGKQAAPERLILFTKSGKQRKGEKPLSPTGEFSFVRPSVFKTIYGQRKDKAGKVGTKTEKAKGLLRTLIKGSTFKGESILDPFSGSGVTVSAALEAGRKPTVVEKREAGVEEAKRRAQDAIKEASMFPYIDPVTEKEINREDLINLDDFKLVREIKKDKKGKLYRKIQSLENIGKPDLSSFVPEGGMYYYDSTGTLREVGKDYGYMPGLSASNSSFEDVKDPKPKKRKKVSLKEEAKQIYKEELERDIKSDEELFMELDKVSTLLREQQIWVEELQNPQDPLGPATFHNAGLTFNPKTFDNLFDRNYRTPAVNLKFIRRDKLVLGGVEKAITDPSQILEQIGLSEDMYDWRDGVEGFMNYFDMWQRDSSQFNIATQQRILKELESQYVVISEATSNLEAPANLDLSSFGPDLSFMQPQTKLSDTAPDIESDDITDIPFQIDETIHSNTLDAVVNSTILSGTPKQWMDNLNRMAINPQNFKQDMRFVGLENFLNNIQNAYPDNKIPKDAILDYIDINKTKITRITPNAINISNRFYSLGDIIYDSVIDDTGGETMLIEDIIAPDEQMISNIEPIIRRLIRFASDKGYRNISFKRKDNMEEAKGLFFEQTIPEMINDVVETIDPKSGPVLNDINGEPYVSIDITKRVINASTNINLPSFQIDDSSIPVDEVTLNNGGTTIKTDIISRYLRSDRGMPAAFEGNVERIGKIKRRMLEAETIRKEMERAIKENMKSNNPFTLQQINEALQDPSSKIKDIRQRVEFLKHDKDRFRETSKELKGVNNKIDAKIKVLEQEISELENEHAGKFKLEDISSDVNLHDSVVRARGAIDNLSKEMIDSGVVQGELKATIQDNLGIYTMKQYRAHHDDKLKREYRKKLGLSWWQKKFGIEKTMEDFLNDQTVMGKAVNFIYNNQLENHRKNPTKYSKPSFKSVVATIETLMGDHKTEIRSKVVNTNTSRDHVLKRRKDIPPPIAELLNEIQNPVFNFVNTMSQMANTLETKRYMNDMLQLYKGRLIFPGVKSGNVVYPPDSQHTEKIVVDGEVFYTTKFAKDQILGYEEMGSAVMRTYMKFLGLVKMGKTVYSPATHARNFTSNFGFAVSQGHVNPKHIWKAWGVTQQIFNESSDAEKRMLFRRLVEYGVVDDVADLNELRDILRGGGWGQFLNPMSEPVSIDPKTGLSKINPLRLLGKASQSATNAYLFEDAYWKVVGFMHETKRYEDAGLNKEEAMREAAEIIRNVYPTYSKVPEAIRQLRVFPLAGTFVSYPAEVVRTSIMTAKQIKREINSDNAKVRRIGYTRLAGTSFYHTAFPVAAAMVIKGIGMGISAIIKLAGGDEEDALIYDTELMQNERIADLIRFVGPEYHKNSQIIPMIEVEPGVYYYWAVSDNNSHGYYTEIFNSIFNRTEDDPTFSKKDLFLFFKDPTFHAIFEPFIGEDILFKRIREVASNEKGSGAPIYEDQDTGEEILYKSFNYILEGVTPSVVNNIQRIYESINPEDPDDIKYDMKMEMLALAGVRLSKIDLAESFKYKMRSVDQYITGLNPEKEIDWLGKTFDEKLVRMLEFADNYTEAMNELGIERSTVKGEDDLDWTSNYKLGADWRYSDIIKNKMLEEYNISPHIRDIILRDKTDAYGIPDVKSIKDWALKIWQEEKLKELDYERLQKLEKEGKLQQE